MQQDTDDLASEVLSIAKDAQSLMGLYIFARITFRAPPNTLFKRSSAWSCAFSTHQQARMSLVAHLSLPGILSENVSIQPLESYALGSHANRKPVLLYIYTVG